MTRRRKRATPHLQRRGDVRLTLRTETVLDVYHPDIAAHASAYAVALNETDPDGREVVHSVQQCEGGLAVIRVEWEVLTLREAAPWLDRLRKLTKAKARAAA